MSRATRRALGGKRQFERECRQDVLRVLELAGRGFSTSTIASSTGLTEGLVTLILEQARKAEEGGGVVR